MDTSFKWKNAYYDNNTGELTLNQENNNFWVFDKYKKAGKDRKDLKSFPTICPYCDDNWGKYKDNEQDLMYPISNITYGFQKINQILADTLLREQNNKNLVLFSDSRQDAAKLAAGIEMDHYRDTLRQLALKAIKNIIEGKKAVIDFYEKGKDSIDLNKEYLIEIFKKRNKDFYNEIKDFYRYPEDLNENEKSKVKFKIDNNYVSFNEIFNRVYWDFINLGMNPGSYRKNEVNLNGKNYFWWELYDWNNEDNIKYIDQLPSEEFELA